MKKMTLGFSIFLYSFCVSSIGGAVETVKPDGGAATQQQQGFSSCAHADHKIEQYCTSNPAYINYQANNSAWKAMAAGSRNSGTKAATQEGITQLNAADASINQMLQVCSEALKGCENICENEYNKASQQRPNPNTAAMNQANTTAKKCVAEYKEMAAKATAAKMDINQILQTLMAALQMIQGMGGDSAAALTNPEEDPCEGQYKDILVECKEQSDPSSRSAGLSTGVGSVVGVNGEGLFQASSQDDPGGEGKNNSLKASGVAASGGSMGSFGGGYGSSLGSSSAGGDSAEKGLDTDIQKGFMSADGAGGSGGGGSGGSMAAAAPFGKYSGLGGGEGLTKEDSLQKKLNQLASHEKRGLASSGDANGPFQDNWEIIKKAYKNNTQTMYHQK